jgi:DNA repair exonuclease SbcCD nuclease subunit
MAGDIHKRQVIRRGNTEIVYPGSMIQQTFGETVSQHGFAVWDIENKTYEFIDLETNYGLYDFEITRPEDIDEDKEILKN